MPSWFQRLKRPAGSLEMPRVRQRRAQFKELFTVNTAEDPDTLPPVTERPKQMCKKALKMSCERDCLRVSQKQILNAILEGPYESTPLTLRKACGKLLVPVVR